MLKRRTKEKMRSEENLILNCGEIVKSIISFIRDTRNKYNIPKDKLVLYIDMWSKDVEIMDIQLIGWEGIISKFNMGNLDKVEYSLYELFENDIYFEATNIDGYNICLALPTIQKEAQMNDFTNEISRLESQKIKYQNKLSDEKFTLKAPKDIVYAERKKLTDAESRIQNLKANMLMLTCGKEYYDLLIKLGNNEKINWNIQYQREQGSENEQYEQKWFDEIYNPQINNYEIKTLHSKICA
jgi:valyl-tRNA synthetase